MKISMENLYVDVGASRGKPIQSELSAVFTPQPHRLGVGLVDISDYSVLTFKLFPTTNTCAANGLRRYTFWIFSGAMYSPQKKRKSKVQNNKRIEFKKKRNQNIEVVLKCSAKHKLAWESLNIFFLRSIIRKVPFCKSKSTIRFWFQSYLCFTCSTLHTYSIFFFNLHKKDSLK